MKSCPFAPGLCPIEANRRKEKLNKKVGQKVDMMAQCTESDIKEKHNYKPIKADCGCNGITHNDDCLRLRGGAGHDRLPRYIPGPHLAPDPDYLAPHLLQQIILVIHH